MERHDVWMKDPELKAAYEALGPNFRREVELAQQRRGQRTVQGTAIVAGTGRSAARAPRSHAHPGGAARR
ncbi:hypothetical protein A6A40_26045 (plasmid) [Azospirillum humicireducens]|uniref:Uncharacterized protein n=1 Tax=Azospirillum humicireducens TaxID=1226968 RepID=A0A2R4VVQ6_9PROT|nr:hypothetical protein [Azospirillum humicireducens]AWB08471.1 hypothetical protein A6A40_26045 [Azospirillum humicireducens]